IPAASQPRIIGSRSAGRPTPRSDQTSWWLSAVALTETVVHPAGGCGSGRSPVSRPPSGFSASMRTAETANMTTTLPEGQSRLRGRSGLAEGVVDPEAGELPEVAVRRDELTAVLDRQRRQVGIGDQLGFRRSLPA